MYYVYCDASIEPKNPGGHGVGGYVIKGGNGSVVLKGAYDFGQYPELTNNCCEYGAIAAALQRMVKEGMTTYPLTVRTDSQLVVKQLNGDFGCSDKMFQMRSIVVEIAKLFPSVTYEWIPREENTEADTVSRSLYVRE